MDGLEKITARIREDADQELAALNAQTEEQIAALQAQTDAQAEKERAEILSRGERAAAERLERVKSAAQMERRKLELAAKQEVLSEAFEKALDKLCALPDEEYVPLLTALVLQAASTGREQVIFSPKDRSRIGKAVVVAANEAMVKQAVPELPETLTESKVGAFFNKVVQSAAAQLTGTGLLTLSEETRPMRGGCILVDGPVEINCSFETMLHIRREKLEKPAAEILFGV